MSESKSVTDGSNCVLRVVVYSEILRKPKNAVVMAAQSIILSSKNLDELNRFWLMMRKREGVMGRRLGREWRRPWARLIPRSTKYNCSKSLKGMVCPCEMEWCLMAARWSLTFECELYDAR